MQQFALFAQSLTFQAESLSVFVQGIQVRSDFLEVAPMRWKIAAVASQLLEFLLKGGMDAVPFFIGTKGRDVKKPVSQFDMLRELREFLQWREGASIIIAEANVKPGEDLDYFGEDGDRMHMPVR